MPVIELRQRSTRAAGGGYVELSASQQQQPYYYEDSDLGGGSDLKGGGSGLYVECIRIYMYIYTMDPCSYNPPLHLTDP